MKKVFIKYNPYMIRTEITIDGERLTNKVVDTINEITIRRGESPILQ